MKKTFLITILWLTYFIKHQVELTSVRLKCSWGDTFSIPDSPIVCFNLYKFRKYSLSLIQRKGFYGETKSYQSRWYNIGVLKWSQNTRCVTIRNSLHKLLCYLCHLLCTIFFPIVQAIWSHLLNYDSAVFLLLGYLHVCRVMMICYM